MGSTAVKAAYIADNPLFPGVRWLRIELSLSVAMIRCYRYISNKSEETSIAVGEIVVNVEKRP